MLSRKLLVSFASVFPARVNKWILFGFGVAGVGLAVGDVLYRMAKDVSLADERRRGRGMMMHLYLWH